MSEQKIPSLGDWIITLLLMSIPLVNFVVLIYWAVSSSTDPIKSNFAKAALYTLFFGAMIGALL